MCPSWGHSCWEANVCICLKHAHVVRNACSFVEVDHNRLPTLITGPFGVTHTKTLSGFRSRWVMPRLCRKATALQSCFTTLWLRWASGGLESRYWFKSPPSQYSITSHRAKQRKGPGCSSCLWAGLFLLLFCGLRGVVPLDELDLALSWMVLVLSWSLQTEWVLPWLWDCEFLSWLCGAPITLPFNTLSTRCKGSFPDLRGLRVLGPVCRRQLWSAITLAWFLAVDLIAHSSCRYSSMHSGLQQGSRLIATLCPVLAIWPSKTTP